jgi:4-hydroxybenzoate polyprenyltransferase
MPFWGNFIVSALSAFVILIVWLFEFFLMRIDGLRFARSMDSIPWINRLVLAYALFAFLLTLVREIIKDMEDAGGDRASGSRTLPIAVGLHNTRRITASIIGATMLLLGYALTILYQLGLYMVFWYMIITTLAGSAYLLAELFRAREKKDYHYLSSLCKLIMVAGILSMEVIYISN